VTGFSAATGLNGAAAIGVPLGAGMAQASTWRSALLLVTVLGLLSAVAVGLVVGPLPVPHAVALGQRLAMLRRRPVPRILAMTVLGCASGMGAYTYIADTLRETVGARGTAFFILLAHKSPPSRVTCGVTAGHSRAGFGFGGGSISGSSAWDVRRAR
jgi:predicted MFS family arabinose efflux permease